MELKEKSTIILIVLLRLQVATKFKILPRYFPWYPIRHKKMGFVCFSKDLKAIQYVLSNFIF